MVERCRELERDGAVVLRGNHDTLDSQAAPTAATWGSMSSSWTQQHLDAIQRDWLAQLPLTALIDSVFLVHATADMPERWHYVEDERLASRLENGR